MRPNAIVSFLALVLLSSQAAGADLADDLVGVWRVTGVAHRVLQTGEVEKPFGERPTGVATFSSGGYFTWHAVAERRGAVPPLSQGGYTPRALFETAAFGSGRYRVEADRVILRYEHAWNQVWSGVERIDTVRIDDDVLTWKSAPLTTYAGALVVSISTYERDCGVRLPWLRSKTKSGGPFAGYTPVFRSGDALSREGVFAVALQPAADTVYFARTATDPTRGYGGIVTLEHVHAGRYGIVLSEEALITAVQHRPFLTIPVDQWRTEANCLSMAEVVVESGPVTLQIRGAAGPLIKISMIKISD
jgi:Lipocalin-like domain